MNIIYLISEQTGLPMHQVAKVLDFSGIKEYLPEEVHIAIKDNLAEEKHLFEKDYVRRLRDVLAEIEHSYKAIEARNEFGNLSDEWKARNLISLNELSERIAFIEAQIKAGEAKIYEYENANRLQKIS